MKKVKNIFSLIIMVLLPCYQILNAQGYFQVDPTEDLYSKLRLNKNIAGVEKYSYSDIEGNPFIYSQFAQGNIIFKNGEKYQLNLRYDIYTHLIQFKEKDEVYSFVNPENIALVTIDTLSFQYVPYLKSPDDVTSLEKAFLIVKKAGKCNLLIKKNIRLQPAELPKPFQDAKPAKFIHIGDSYYLKLENMNAVRIDTKKDLLNILKDKKEEVEKFINSNKLGTKNLQDLEKTIIFYNNLQ